jgi:hypothetical protein
VKNLIGKLDLPARETLQCLMRFLVKVIAHSDNNKMKSQYVRPDACSATPARR